MSRNERQAGWPDYSDEDKFAGEWAARGWKLNQPRKAKGNAMKDEGDMLMPIEPGTHWNHKREGYHARVSQFDKLFVKDANDANWQPAVAYQLDDDDRIFVRAQRDFVAKFAQDERLGDEE